MFLDFTTLVVRVLWILLTSHLPLLQCPHLLAMHHLQLSLLMAFELSLPPIDHYGYSGAAFLETTSYHDAFVHPEWRHAIVEEIVALARIGMWDIISLPPCCMWSTYSHHLGILFPMAWFVIFIALLWP